LPAGTHIETVRISSPQLRKRVQRVRTDHDREVGIRLADGEPDLRDGDILQMSAQGAIVVQVTPSDVIVIRPGSVVEAATVGHTLGNRHLQVQFFGADSDYGADVMVVEFDHTVVDYLDTVHVSWERQQRVMSTPFRHVGHTH
jgi:urease accessory protein